MFYGVNDMNTLTINGSERQFTDDNFPLTIAKLLEELKINSAAVVAEVDGQVVERQKFSETRLSDGQKIELIRFMGGG